MHTQPDAQAAIEALERRRLQNRIAQRNRRKLPGLERLPILSFAYRVPGALGAGKRRAELEQKRQQELEGRTSSSQEQEDGRARPSQYGTCGSELGSVASDDASLHRSMGYMHPYHDLADAIPHFLLDPELASPHYSTAPLLSPKQGPLVPATPKTNPSGAPEVPPEETIRTQVPRKMPLWKPSHWEAAPPIHPSILMSPPSTTTWSLPSGNSNSGVNRGKTALHITAERGNLRIVQFLLANEVDVDVADAEGRTALHYAARGAHADIVALLLAEGADPEARDREGRSPLHAAADAECELVIRLLAKEGADLNAAIGVASGGGGGGGSGGEETGDDLATVDS